MTTFLRHNAYLNDVLPLSSHASMYDDTFTFIAHNSFENINENE